MICVSGGQLVGQRPCITCVAVKSRRRSPRGTRIARASPVVGAIVLAQSALKRVRPSRAGSSSAANARNVGPYQSRNRFTTSSGPNGYSNVISRRVNVSDAQPAPIRARTASSVPHCSGDGIPAGGGT